MSTDLKPSKGQISKIIQSGGFLGSLLSKLAGENKNDDYENEDDETIDQNKKIKDLNDNLNEIIDKSNIWRTNKIVKKN